MVRKLGKVLCYLCLFAILAVEPAQNLTKKVVTCTLTTPIEALRICNSCVVYEHKTKNVQGEGPSNKAVFYHMLNSLMFLLTPDNSVQEEAEM